MTLPLNDSNGPAAISPIFKVASNPPPKQKTPPFSLRFSADERERLDREAGGLPLGAYIRERLFGEEASPRRSRSRRPIKDHQTLARLLSDLGKARLANNLNQLAKAVNTGTLRLGPDTEAAIMKACRDIEAMRRDVISALGLEVHERS